MVTDSTHETKFSQKHDVVGEIQSFTQREGAKNKWHFSFFGGKAEYESNTYSGGVAILLPNPSPPPEAKTPSGSTLQHQRRGIQIF